MDINEGKKQEGMKTRAGIGAKNINKSTSNAGRNHANRVNILAKQRMEKIRRAVSKMDMLDAVSRLKIKNLPVGLRSKLIQRMMYFRGNIMYYRDFDLSKDFMLPYSLTAEDNQNIDFYGQYTLVKPTSFNGKSTDDRNPTKSVKSKQVYLGTITRIPVYDMEELKTLLKSKGKEWCQENLCIIFRDYTNYQSEDNIPNHVMQQPFIDMQAEVLPMLRTAMLKAAMPKLVRASDEGVVDSLLAELETIENSIIEGKTMIPVTAFQDLQEIDSKDAGRVIEVMSMMYEGYGNIRKSFLGVPNDGAFKKNAHMLQDEQDMNSVTSNSILNDCFENFKEGFDMVNKLFELDIMVELSESVNVKKSNGDSKRKKDEDVDGSDGESTLQSGNKEGEL